ncbi:MAG TPA: nucleotide exchange factor GrpE [Gemmataceae bacterium]|nr:nucleotide exchange factor GrpE [Gemmataceae bacterium]
MTPQRVEEVLADFRAWLLGAAEPAPTPPDADAVDLHTLLAQFTALRHEVHLQTRAARAQQEQGAEALRQLGEAVAALQQSQFASHLGDEQGRDETLRPLLKVLVDVYDNLALAEREVRRAEENVVPQPESPPAPRAPSSFWARLFGPAPPAAPQAPPADRSRQVLASILTGYTMSLQRVERALRQQGLEPIPAVGQPFDPEKMEVLEVVSDSGRPPGEVVGEVRRGYLWRGRVFRFAQVRVAKS